MKLRAAWMNVLLVGAAMLAAQSGFAGAKTLIELEGDTPKPALAKSWKKVKDGEYTFDLDTTAEIGKGVTVTPAAVKSALEAKLGASNGVKVAAKGSSGVSISYTGDEKGFLDQLSKTKIRGGQDVALALESSTSEGSIRAKKTERPPGPGEVKAVVLKSEGGVIIAMANQSQNPQVKSGEKVKVKGELKGLKKNDTIFFKPASKQGEVFVPAAGSLIQ